MQMLFLSRVPVKTESHVIHRSSALLFVMIETSSDVFVKVIRYLIEQLGEVKNAAFKITLALGDFCGTHDSSLREIRDGC